MTARLKVGHHAPNMPNEALFKIGKPLDTISVNQQSELKDSHMVFCSSPTVENDHHGNQKLASS
jgi:hypothetical protein